eukprot:g7258.t1
MVRGLFLTSGALGLTIRASPELWALQRTAEERLGPYEALGGSKLLVALGAVPEARDLVADAEPFELSSERFERLQILVSAAHAKGLEVGADVPLFLQQQHSLNLLPNSGDYEAEVRRRVQWLRAIGFDHLGTELGSTEFTRGLPATETIRLLNIIQESFQLL